MATAFLERREGLGNAVVELYRLSPRPKMAGEYLLFCRYNKHSNVGKFLASGITVGGVKSLEKTFNDPNQLQTAISDWDRFSGRQYRRLRRGKGFYFIDVKKKR